jgi:excisionase family DNA binding protein
MSDHANATDLTSGSCPAPLMDARQAGRLLNVPPSWVLAEARADRIPHIRLGRYVRFDADELAVWWRSRRRGPWRSRGAASFAARTAS